MGQTLPSLPPRPCVLPSPPLGGSGPRPCKAGTCDLPVPPRPLRGPEGKPRPSPEDCWDPWGMALRGGGQQLATQPCPWDHPLGHQGSRQSPVTTGTTSAPQELGTRVSHTQGPASASHTALTTAQQAGRRRCLFMACTERHRCRVQRGSMAVCPGNTSSPLEPPGAGGKRGDGGPLHFPTGSPGAGALLLPPWGTSRLGLPAAERSRVGMASHTRRLARASCQMLPGLDPAQPARHGGPRGRCLSPHHSPVGLCEARVHPASLLATPVKAEKGRGAGDGTGRRAPGLLRCDGGQVSLCSLTAVTLFS